MWRILETDEYSRRYRRYAKKKKNELKAVVRNLDIFIKTLQAGKPPKPPIYGFLHIEPAGIMAIDQTGGIKLAATRLYVYPVPETETLYLLTIGDKDGQSDDIAICKAFIQEIITDPDQWENEDDGREHDEEGGD